MDRRTFIGSSIGGCALFSSFTARAQDKLPEGQLNIYLGFPAGSATDATGRAIAERLRIELGRPVIIMNQPGATGMISLERLKRAPADGTVIGLVPLTSGLIAPMFKTKVDFNLLNDYDPIAMVGHYALAFSVAKKLPVEDWKGFVQWARANPNELFYGHGGPGSMAQLVGAAVAGATGLKFQDVPFKGDTDSLSAVVGGQVQTAISSTVAVSAQHQAKRLKVLAVTSRERAPGLPDVPTFVELGYPTAVSEPWMAFFAPKGTPPQAIAEWNRALNVVLQTSDFRQSLSRQGYTVAGGTPAALKETVASETVRWRKVMDAAGFKPLD